MWWFSQTGSSGFSARSTAQEVTAGIDATGLLHSLPLLQEHQVVSDSKLHELLHCVGFMLLWGLETRIVAKEMIIDEIPTAKVDVMTLDLSSIASVRKFAAEFKSRGLPLYILMDHGDPFHTFQRQYRATVCYEPFGYSNFAAYGQSKLANVLHSNGLARHLKEERLNITVNALHPGAIATNLFRHIGLLSGIMNIVGKYATKNVQQGAATTCYLALHPQVKENSGKYFADCNLAESSSQANDTELANKLWDLSLNLICKSSSSP